MKSVIALTIVLVGIIFVNCDDIFGDGPDYTACGKNARIDRATGFIIKNKNAQNPPGSWPWMVSMGRPDESAGGGWTHMCGGALVTRDVVVTAAHCPLGVETEILEGLIFIRAGDDHLQQDDDDGDVQVIEVESFAAHPDYYKIFNTRYSDVAVLRLSSPVSLSAEVRTICLPEEPRPRVQDNNLPLVVTGWGNEGLTGSQFGGSLLSTIVQVYPEEHCNDTHLGQRNNERAVPEGFTSDLFCAGDTKGTEGVCQGDSGSPAVFQEATKQRYILKGVVSGGLRCGTLDYPNIFVRVSDRGILGWIYSQIGKTLPTTTTTTPSTTPNDTKIPQTERSCSALESCETRQTCPYIQTKYNEVRQAVPETRPQLIEFLKSITCNKRKKAFCCPKSGFPHQSPAPVVPQDPRGTSKTDSNCDYRCKSNGGCTVKYVGPSRPGKSQGSCSSAAFRGICRGIPSECFNCNTVLDCGSGAVTLPPATAPTFTHTEDLCEYDCKADGSCSAKYIGPSRSGSKLGSCASAAFGSKCFGIPPECGSSCHPFCSGK